MVDIISENEMGRQNDQELNTSTVTTTRKDILDLFDLCHKVTESLTV